LLRFLGEGINHFSEQRHPSKERKKIKSMEAALKERTAQVKVLSETVETLQYAGAGPKKSANEPGTQQKCGAEHQNLPKYFASDDLVNLDQIHAKVILNLRNAHYEFICSQAG
jgi:hypothetical protein